MLLVDAAHAVDRIAFGYERSTCTFQRNLTPCAAAIRASSA